MVAIQYKLEQLISLIQPTRVQGKTNVEHLTGIACLRRAKAGDISFLGNQKYKGEVFKCRATVILVGKDYVGTPQENQVYLHTENASKSLDIICRDIENKTRPIFTPGIHSSAIIDPSAKVSPKACIGPLCVIEKNAVIEDGVILHASVFIGEGVYIGHNTLIRPNVSILRDTHIGRNGYIDSGVVIGSEGYGYETENGVHKKSPQIGRVVVEDNVDIGANTTIDRARFYETRIGEGTKIDNLVQIGHNVIIGKNCFIVAFVGIAGSTVVEDNCIIGGQVGIAGHLRVGKGSMLGAQTGLNHDLEPGSYVRGTPAYPYMLAHRIDVLKQRLPELFKRIDNLEKVFAYLTTDASKGVFLQKNAQSAD